MFWNSDLKKENARLKKELAESQAELKRIRSLAEQLSEIGQQAAARVIELEAYRNKLHEELDAKDALFKQLSELAMKTADLAQEHADEAEAYKNSNDVDSRIN